MYFCSLLEPFHVVTPSLTFQCCHVMRLIVNYVSFFTKSSFLFFGVLQTPSAARFLILTKTSFRPKLTFAPTFLAPSFACTLEVVSASGLCPKAELVVLCRPPLLGDQSSGCRNDALRRPHLGPDESSQKDVVQLGFPNVRKKMCRPVALPVILHGELLCSNQLSTAMAVTQFGASGCTCRSL